MVKNKRKQNFSPDKKGIKSKKDNDFGNVEYLASSQSKYDNYDVTEPRTNSVTNLAAESVVTNPSCSTSKEINEMKQEIKFQLKLEGGPNYSSYCRDTIKIKKEIESKLPNLNDYEAYFSPFNGNLIIKVKNSIDVEYLESKLLTQELFNNKVSKVVEKARRQFVIINNVHVDLNITEPEFISCLSSNQLFDPVRLKTNGVPNEQIKCEIRNNESLKQLLELGIKIRCSNFRVKEWNPQKRPLQCFKCQKLGHHTKHYII